jgi:hypothetical protein
VDLESRLDLQETLTCNLRDGLLKVGPIDELANSFRFISKDVIESEIETNPTLLNLSNTVLNDLPALQTQYRRWRRNTATSKSAQTT